MRAIRSSFSKPVPCAALNMGWSGVHTDGCNIGRLFVPGPAIYCAFAEGAGKYTWTGYQLSDVARYGLLSADCRFDPLGIYLPGTFGGGVAGDVTQADWGTGDFTVAAVLRIDHVPTNNDSIFTSDTPSQDLNYFASTPRWYNAGDQVISSTSVGAGIRHFIALTRNAGNVTLYLALNSSSLPVSVGTASSNTKTFKVGGIGYTTVALSGTLGAMEWFLAFPVALSQRALAAWWLQPYPQGLFVGDTRRSLPSTGVAPPAVTRKQLLALLGTG